MAKIIERAGARYDMQEVEFGEVYKWRPESMVAECERSERPTLTGVVPGEGERGADDTPAVREDRYSWLDGCLEWLEGKEARHEYYARLGERAASR